MIWIYIYSNYYGFLNIYIYELEFQTTSGKVFLGPTGHVNIRTPITTSGALWSGPPSTYLNAVTVLYIMVISGLSRAYKPMTGWTFTTGKFRL